jgi:ketosteroid isomerase-like protein
MTSNRDRADRLAAALRAMAEGDRTTLGQLLAADVRMWSPEVAASSLDELLEALERRDDAFSDVALDVVALDVGGEHACAEWTLSVRHTGPIGLADGSTYDATGLPVELHGVTVAEFHGERICALRQYWDVTSLLDQLGDSPGRVG